MSDRIYQSGDFFRAYPPNPIVAFNSFSFQGKFNYIAGATPQRIFVGQTTDPIHLLAFKQALTDTALIKINIEPVEPVNFYSINIEIDSPYFYYVDGSIPLLYRGSLRDWTVDEVLEDRLFFQAMMPLDDNSCIIRSISKSKHENVLGKLYMDSSRVDFAYNLLERQIDGIFCTDGMLHFDKDLNRIVYLYYYRNQYLVADSNLQLCFRGNTIDTFSVAQVKTRILTLENQKSNQLATPPPIVNKHSCVYRGWLFVHSNVMAKNEQWSVFGRSDVVDVYDLTKNAYVFSFHIPYKDSKGMKAFNVVNAKLFVLYESFIVGYNLNMKYFDLGRLISG